MYVRILMSMFVSRYYVCVGTYVCIYLCAYEFMQVRKYVRIYVGMYVRMYVLCVCMYVCRYVCTCVRMYGCVRLCLWLKPPELAFPVTLTFV